MPTILVTLPAPLHRAAGGVGELVAEGETVALALASLRDSHPAVARLFLDDEELSPAQISRITLGDGVLSIHREGAVEGLFRSKGIERVLAADVADLDVVLRALERWGRFPISAG